MAGNKFISGYDDIADGGLTIGEVNFLVEDKENAGKYYSVKTTPINLLILDGQTMPTATAGNEVVVNVATQTLTNKTIDADDNTISNLMNANIADDADIALTKLALPTGVTSTEIGLLANARENIQEQLDAFGGRTVAVTKESDSGGLFKVDAEDIFTALSITGVDNDDYYIDYTRLTVEIRYIDVANSRERVEFIGKESTAYVDYYYEPIIPASPTNGLDYIDVKTSVASVRDFNIIVRNINYYSRT